MSNKTLRVVVCGDDGVGKTSLLVSLLKNKFVPNLQDVLPPVTIPRDFSSSPYSPQSTVVIDTTNNNNDDDDILQWQATLKSADVIWLVYSDHESYERISFHWMMTFRSLGLNIPVILCKNKCDEYTSEHSEDLTHDNNNSGKWDTKVEDEEFIPILMEFKEIDTCIKASAMTKYNINQAFYLCQRAVTHPVAPLFDARLGQLKPLASEALQRIFLLCDNDQDNYLNDQEINYLQRKCFQKSVDINELEYIKQILLNMSYSNGEGNNNNSNNNENNSNNNDILYVPGKGITKEGFLALNKIYVEKGRHETIWGILRAFKYTDSLSLDDSILHPKINISPTASVELSPTGYRFLVNLFVKFDKDNDGGLNDVELITLFKATPGLPKLWSSTNFPFSTVINNRGYITLQGWLAQWAMTTFIDYKIVTEYLIYFGYDDDTRGALQITKSRKYRRRSGKNYRAPVKDRKVFNCFIIGRKFSGKTSLLEMFLGRIFSNSYTPTSKPQIAVNSLELKGGKQYYLILQEFGEMEDQYLENIEKFKNCDVLCLTYDSSDPDSFSHLIELFNKYQHIKDLPIIIVALKADLDKQQQRCSLQPDEFCDKLYINHPLHISSNWLSSLNELFIKITEAALLPASSTPDLSEEVKKTISNIDYRQTAVVLGSTVGFISLLSFTLLKFARNKLDNN